MFDTNPNEKSYAVDKKSYEVIDFDFIDIAEDERKICLLLLQNFLKVSQQVI